MTQIDPPAPMAMLAARLQRASEADFFARLTASGHPELRMRHPLLLQALEPDGARAAALAAELGVSQQAIGELVDDLVRRGYVTRRPDPTDRRARLVVLTPKGSRTLVECRGILEQMEREYAALVGEEAWGEVRTAMQTVIAKLESR